MSDECMYPGCHRRSSGYYDITITGIGDFIFHCDDVIHKEWAFAKERMISERRKKEREEKKMSHYIERWCQEHKEWDDDVDCPSEGCPKCIEEGKFKTRAMLKAEVERLTRERDEAQEDAERYRKKRDIDAGAYVRSDAYRNNPPRVRDSLLAAWWEAYNAAIDAAREEK